MAVEPCRPCGSSARDVLQGEMRPQVITVTCPTIGTEHTDATKNDFFFQDTAPACTNAGDIWVETDYDPPRIHECDGTSWRRSSYSGMADMIGQVEGTQISDLSIDSTHIMDNAIITRAIAAEAILAGKIASSAVTAGKIDAGAVDANKISTLYLDAAADAKFGTAQNACFEFRDEWPNIEETTMQPSIDGKCSLGDNSQRFAEGWFVYTMAGNLDCYTGSDFGQDQTDYIDLAAGPSADVTFQPTTGGTCQLGTSTKSFNKIYGNELHGTVYYQDIAFEEKKCEICGEPFEVGERIELVVTSVENDSIKARPVHSRCK